MICAAIFFILLYYCSFMFYYKKLFPVSGVRVIPFALILFLIVALYITLNAYNLLWVNMPAVMVAMICGLRFTTGLNWLQAVYGGITCALSAYCSRGIFTAISAIIFQGRDFLSDADTYYAITLFALPIALAVFKILRRTIFLDEKLKRFLCNSSQLQLVIVYEIAASINLMVMNSGRYLSPNNIWYVGVALGTCMLTLGVLVFAIYQSIRSTELLEYQFKNLLLEQQYARQLRHYKSYQKYIESFQAFKHDYKSMMASVKTLIRAQENKQAIRLIDGIYDDMQKKVQIHKKYSDHVVLDAILQDLADICIENEIRFSFQVFAPRCTGLSLLDAIRIFHNITANAVEACKKLPAVERFMDITSFTDQRWVVLRVANSYNGEVYFKNGKLVTTKADKQNHGLGFGIVCEIVENLGGFVLYNTIPEKRIFEVRIHIPQIKKQPSDAGQQ